MTDGEKLRRFGFDKIAFLILLLAGLAIAKLIISWRVNFKMSEPVALEGTGVSVSVPTGGGFGPLSGGFQYNDSEFRLSAVMRISNDTAVMANWRYFIVPLKKTPAERFEKQASDIEGAIEKTGSEKLGQLTFDYARIVSSKNSTLLLSATTLLPDGRTLALEVAQKGRNVNLVEEIFRSLVASAAWTPDSPLARGSRLLNTFKNKTIADIAKKKSQQDYFYIKNYTGRQIGFITDAISVKTDKLTAANLYFFKVGVNSLTERSLFRSDLNLKNFKWVSLQSDLLINRDSATSIELKENTVTVRNEKTEQDFAFTPTMIPDILVDTLIESFLRSDSNSIMIDMILSDGSVAPALITRTQKQQGADPNIAFTVDVQFFGMDASRQIMYLDSNAVLLLSEVHGRLSYKLEKTQKNRLAADFPDWLEKIQQIGQYILVADAPQTQRKNEKSKD